MCISLRGSVKSSALKPMGKCSFLTENVCFMKKTVMELSVIGSRDAQDFTMKVVI